MSQQPPCRASALVGVLFFVLAFAATAVASAAPVTTSLSAVADTTLRQQQTNQNRGTDEQLRLGWAQGSRALVRFDPAAIANAVGTGTLVSAHLELEVEATGESWPSGNQGVQNVGVHRLTAEWTEAGATWNCAIDAHPADNRADCTPLWNGGSFLAAATATVPHTKETRGLVRFDVTADVAAFLAGTANRGWLLKKANEALSGRIDYASREGTATERRPRLVLVVEPGGGGDTTPPVVAITLPADGAFLPTGLPQVQASFTDAGSGIDPARTKVLLDTVDRSAEASLSAAGLTWTPSEPLSELTHFVEVVAYDHAGNSASALAWFVVDKTAPGLTVEAPVSGLTVNLDQIEVTGAALDENGEPTVEVGGQPVALTDGRFQQLVTLTEGEQTVTVRAVDRAGNVRVEARSLTLLTLPEVSITAPEDLSFLAATTVAVSGTVSDTASAVVVNGVDATVSGHVFMAADVPLVEGGNVLTATVTDAHGRRGTDTINVVRDLTAPRVAIHQPEEGSRVFDTTTTVSGMINDIVAGTVNASEATVTVNGRPATMLNRSFMVPDVPLSPGDNTLTAVAVDESGNRGEASVTVRREITAAARLAVVSGNLQEGNVSTTLSQPLVVVALDASGQPVADRPVLFAVLEGSGHFAGGLRQVMATTGADGRAQAVLTLGTRAGVANQAVEASSPNFAAVVCRASARAGPPANLLADAGTLQVGVAGQALPRPFVAVVTDAGFNRLPGVDVALRVVEGGGVFADGLAETVVTTDSDGRVVVPFTLGLEEGIANNVVEAVIAGLDPSPKAGFVASGRVAGEAAATSISGVVLDNVNQPVAGVTLRIKEQPSLTAQTDAQGQFRIAGAPVGTVHLIVDGSTASRPGSWPDLEFLVTTIPGRDVGVNMPIFLLPIDVGDGIFVDETRGGTLTLLEVPGFSLEVAPGSVTFPGGSRSGVISVTAVHSDKVPMVPNFGQQPRFIVTIQPAGARFDPQARLTLPNLEGLAPGATTELYSFDHDLGHFVSIGPGSVSEDGMTIVSDPGVGVIKAGWHCGGDPAAAGTPADCPSCQICNGTACVEGCPLSSAASIKAGQDEEEIRQIVAAAGGCNCTKPGEVCYKGKCTCAVPTNYQETHHEVKPNGDLYFEYKWSSNTGRTRDLSACQVGEQVLYPGSFGDGVNYQWPAPWTGSTQNPSTSFGPATAAFLSDIHDSKLISQPYQAASIAAQQRYSYICPCANNGNPAVLLGPHPITRTISQNPDGTWKYTISKTGQTGTRPLP